MSGFGSDVETHTTLDGGRSRTALHGAPVVLGVGVPVALGFGIFTSFGLIGAVLAGAAAGWVASTLIAVRSARIARSRADAAQAECSEERRKQLAAAKVSGAFDRFEKD